MEHHGKRLLLWLWGVYPDYDKCKVSTTIMLAGSSCVQRNNNNSASSFLRFSFLLTIQIISRCHAWNDQTEWTIGDSGWAMDLLFASGWGGIKLNDVVQVTTVISLLRLIHPSVFLISGMLPSWIVLRHQKPSNYPARMRSSAKAVRKLRR